MARQLQANGFDAGMIYSSSTNSVIENQGAALMSGFDGTSPGAIHFFHPLWGDAGTGLLIAGALLVGMLKRGG